MPSLGRTPLQHWNGLLFDGPRNVADDLAALGIADFDFSGYVYDRTRITEYKHNWKTFIEVYLEDYHVEPFHPGLGHFVHLRRPALGIRAAVLGADRGREGQPAEAGHADLRQVARRGARLPAGKAPKHGAIWIIYYPNIMVEWYPHVLVVSTLIPRGPQHTTNVVEFYYPEEIALFEREFVEAEQTAYKETAVEDDEIAVRMDAGRALLFEMGRGRRRPYQSPMEDGMVHFHEYIRRNIGDRA